MTVAVLRWRLFTDHEVWHCPVRAACRTYTAYWQVALHCTAVPFLLHSKCPQQSASHPQRRRTGLGPELASASPTSGARCLIIIITRSSLPLSLPPLPPSPAFSHSLGKGLRGKGIKYAGHFAMGHSAHGASAIVKILSSFTEPRRALSPFLSHWHPSSVVRCGPPSPSPG